MAGIKAAIGLAVSMALGKDKALLLRAIDTFKKGSAEKMGLLYIKGLDFLRVKDKIVIKDVIDKASWRIGKGTYSKETFAKMIDDGLLIRVKELSGARLGLISQIVRKTLGI